MHILIDNYDSFTYNIAQAIGELGHQVEVLRNDAASVVEIIARRPQSVIVSPGPGEPGNAGVSVDLIRQLDPETPVLGICLGHQCIVAAAGGAIDRAPRVMHGKVSNVYHDGRTIYDGLSNPFTATRYHSLIAREAELPDNVEISAYTSDGEIMGVRLKDRKVEGVQFHPESVLTPEGKKLIDNFLSGTGRAK